MNTAPKRIYLDIGDQFALEAVASGAQRWDLLEGIIWSEDNATSHGVPYVRADLVPTPAASRAATPLTDAERAELDQLRLLAGGQSCIPKVQELLGPMSLWSAAGLKEHIEREIAAALAALEAAQPASPAPLTDEQQRTAFVAAMVEAGYSEPGRGMRPGSQYLYQRDEDRFVGWMLARAALASPQVAPALTLEVLREILVKHDRSLPVACAEEILASAAMGAESEPVAFVNRDELDNMLDDRTATIQGQRSGWRKTALYLAAPVQVAPHPDDMAVDRFAAAMKAKLAGARAKGRGGWERPDCTREALSAMLREHVEKGDPRDVANFCMFLHQRGEGIVAPVAPQDDARDAAEKVTSVADRLDAMADNVVAGSQAHSDLLAAATIWRKHLAGPVSVQASRMSDDERSELGATLMQLESDGQTTADYDTLMDWAQKGFLRCTYFKVTQEGWNATMPNLDDSTPAAKPTEPTPPTQGDAK